MHPWVAMALLGPAAAAAAPTGRPVLVAIDAEFGHVTSTSAEAIRRGAAIAVDEVNRAGGVLGGRPLALVTRDDRSIPSRAVQNVRELAADPDVVAIIAGKFSTVVAELVPVVHELRIPLLAPWSAADAIVENGHTPNYVFRLSLTDTLAIEALMRAAERDGHPRVGLLLPDTAWGRSALVAAERLAARRAAPTIVARAWYDWGDPTLAPQYRALRAAGAQAIVLVANEPEGAVLVRDIAALPPAERLPVFSHWGITGGNFPALAGDALRQVRVTVVQTYSFLGAERRARRVADALRDRFGVASARAIDSPVGVAHAYDLVHLLAKAIDRAGTTDRAAVRDALERLGEHRGLVRVYRPAFTRARHEALSGDDVFLARYAADGALVRIPREGASRGERR